LNIRFAARNPTGRRSRPGLSDPRSVVRTVSIPCYNWDRLSCTHWKKNTSRTTGAPPYHLLCPRPELLQLLTNPLPHPFPHPVHRQHGDIPGPLQLFVQDRGQRHHDSRGVTSGGGRVLIEDGEWWIFLRSRNFTSSPGDGDDVRCPIGLGKRVIADTWRTRIGGEEAV